MTIDNHGSHLSSLFRTRDRRRVLYRPYYWRLIEFRHGTPEAVFLSGSGGLPESDYESGRPSNCVVHHQHYNGTDDSHH
jgi:hypothetical protein